jgi:hypothetical protein
MKTWLVLVWKCSSKMKTIKSMWIVMETRDKGNRIQFIRVFKTYKTMNQRMSMICQLLMRLFSKGTRKQSKPLALTLLVIGY